MGRAVLTCQQQWRPYIILLFADQSKHVVVFPYSIFYVFYEQYLTMVEDTARSLGISLCAVFCVTYILGGLDIKTAIITTLTIILILVSMMIHAMLCVMLHVILHVMLDVMP